MVRRVLAMLALAALAGAPGPAQAGQQPHAGAVPVEAGPPSPAELATHAVRGIVKSISATSMVVTRANHDGGTLTFVLTAATQRAGTPAAGTMVSVRYRKEGQRLVATAVTARDPRHEHEKGKTLAATPSVDGEAPPRSWRPPPAAHRGAAAPPASAWRCRPTISQTQGDTHMHAAIRSSVLVAATAVLALASGSRGLQAAAQAKSAAAHAEHAVAGEVK